MPASRFHILLEGLETRLREERVRLGISQEGLAVLAGTNRMTPSRYESGSHKPTLSFLNEIGRAGIDIDYVLTGKHIELTLAKSDAAQLGRVMSLVFALLNEHKLDVTDEVRGRLLMEALGVHEVVSNTANIQELSLERLLSMIVLSA